MNGLKKYAFMLWGAILFGLGVVVALLTVQPTTVNKIGKQKIKGDDGQINAKFDKSTKKKKLFSFLKRKRKRDN